MLSRDEIDNYDKWLLFVRCLQSDGTPHWPEVGGYRQVQNYMFYQMKTTKYF